MKKIENSYKKINLLTEKSDLKLAIISDTHGVLDERVAAEVAQCDVVLHGGDICGIHILKELALLCDQVIAISGNNDIAAKEWLPEFSRSPELLPPSVLIKLPGGCIAMEHGHKLGNSPSHDALRSRWPDARMIVYGHTHKQIWDKEAAPWIINPGAAGETRTGGGASCAILSASKENWTVELKKFHDADSKVA